MAVRPAGQTTLTGQQMRAVLRALWTVGEGGVADVRSSMDHSSRPAYNTVQTMLNRLVAGGLAERTRDGRSFRYRPAVDEEQYLERAVAEQLEGADPTTSRRVLRRLLRRLAG